MSKSTPNTQPDILVVKIGGSTLGQHDTTLADLVTLQKHGRQVVVVHGGGKVVTDWLSKLGAPTSFVQGERVTDKLGLDVVTAVLAGLVNKELVSAINQIGGQAVGISGADGPVLKGQIKNQALGYVGVIGEVNTGLIKTLLAGGFIPVVSSIGFNADGNSADVPHLLNINADIAAGEIAAALGASSLVFLTDVEGIANKDRQVLPRLTISEAEALIASGAASGGMIPKIHAGIRALATARQSRIIDGRRTHALLQEIERSTGGTTIIR